MPVKSKTQLNSILLNVNFKWKRRQYNNVFYNILCKTCCDWLTGTFQISYHQLSSEPLQFSMERFTHFSPSPPLFPLLPLLLTPPFYCYFIIPDPSMNNDWIMLCLIWSRKLTIKMLVFQTCRNKQNVLLIL